jgi:predicted HicB family RNase H-like nuclease
MGVRFTPEIRRGVKAAAALAGESLEAYLHRVLGNELRRAGLLSMSRERDAVSDNG